MALVDGLAGAVVSVGRQPIAVFAFTVRGGRMTGIKVISDPAGLATLHLEPVPDDRVDLEPSRTRRSLTMSSASEMLDTTIQKLGDWRGETLAEVRRIILAADPGILEEWKWVKPTSPGVPVWSHHGGICTGETYKNMVKLTFYRGAALDDPTGLFNSSLGGRIRRAVDIREGDRIDEQALTDLVRQAIALNILNMRTR